MRYVRTASGWRPKLTAARVYVFWGQSNVRGQAPMAELPVEVATYQSNVYIWNGTAFVGLVAPTTNYYPEGGTNFGPEMAFARLARVTYPSQSVYIIKHAAGGIPLAATTGTTWNPNITGSYYSNATTEFNEAMAVLNGRGLNPIVQGFVWGQGEADATGGVTRATYAARQTELFNAVRTLVGNTALPIADMLIYGTDAGRTAINGAKADVKAGLTYISHIDANTAGWIQADNLHLNGVGQVGFGEAAFNLFK